MSNKSRNAVTLANGHDLLVTTKHESLRDFSIVIPAIFKPESRKNLLDAGLHRCNGLDFHTKAGVWKTLKKLDSGFRRNDATGPCETFMFRCDPATGRSHDRSPA